jgi:hypothetical protein
MIEEGREASVNSAKERRQEKSLINNENAGGRGKKSSDKVKGESSTYRRVYSLVNYYFCAMSYVTFVSGSDYASVWGLSRSRGDD